MTREEMRSRLIEVIVVAGVSILTSAVTVSWSLSATIEGFRNSLADHSKRIDQNATEIKTIVGTNAEQNTALSVNSTQYTEIQRRLDSIDRKLEEQRRR